ncbi:MAG: hypothetical protein KA436_12880 [Oligoflexales bacterium]|nr:hypothetical protein [Oligoflexales bacterium]
MKAQELPAEKLFQGSMEQYLDLRRELQATKTLGMQLSSLEELVEVRGREILRTMLEEHIELRGLGIVGDEVKGSDGLNRTHLRHRAVTIKTIFGAVCVNRIVYGMRGGKSLVPKDAMLNLPENSYSHGLEQRLAREAAKGSFEEAMRSVASQTGVTIPKRQVEEIAQNAAQDFAAFYEERSKDAIRRTTKQNEYLILTTDAKGIVMRKADLREATRKAAEESSHKLKTRLSRADS